MTTPPELDRVRVGTHILDAPTFAALQYAEKLLGHRLTILQGSFRTDVAASGGTHAGSGAVDLACKFGVVPKRVVRVLRSIGFAAWHRTPDEGPWDEHIHAILIGSTQLSAPAARQVVAYLNGRNGLASNLPDPVHHPSPQPIWAFPQTTRGVHVDHSIKAVRRARRAAKSTARKQELTDILARLRALPTRPKVDRI